MYNFYDAERTAQIAILQNTRSQVNQQTQTIRYECTKCESLFTARLYLHQHEATAHNRIFHCPFCESLFSNKADYATHINAHTEKRLIRCGFCKKIFYDVDEFTIHSKLHTEPFLYKCDKCSAMFSQLSKLRIHSATHLNQKFIHTIPKFKKKRRMHPCTNPSEDNLSNPVESNGRNKSASGASVTTGHQTEAPSSPSPCGQEDSNVDTAQEPEADGNRRKRQKKDKGERRQKKMKATEKSAETNTQTLSVDDIEIMPPMIQQIPSTSGHRRVTRQQDRLSKNKKATAKVSETDYRELSEDDTEVTSATKKQIPSNLVLRNTARKRGAGRSRKNEQNHAETETEIEAGRLCEDNIESTTAPEKQFFPSNPEIRSSEDQETDAEIISTTKKRVSKRSKREKIGKKRGRPLKSKNEPTRIERVLRSHFQKYRNAGSVTETEAGGSLEDNIEISSAPEKHISSLNQEILHSEDQETDAGITSTAKNQVSSQSENKKLAKKRGRPLKNKELGMKRGRPLKNKELGMKLGRPLKNKELGKKRGRPLKNKRETTQPKRGLDHLPEYQHAETITNTEGRRLSGDRLELNPTSVEPISPVIEEILATFEQRSDDVQVNSTTKRQPLSSLKDQNVAHKTGKGRSPKAFEQTAETNSSQSRNNNSEQILVVDESISLCSCREQIQAQENCTAIIDLTSSPEHDPEATTDGTLLTIGEVTSFKRKNHSPAKKLEKVQKLKSPLRSKELVQEASASRVSVVRNVKGPLTKIQFIHSTHSNAPISRVTVLKPVTSSKPSAEPSRANEVTSSGGQTCTANHLKRVPCKRRPIYESNLSNGGEMTKLNDTAAKSSTQKEPEMDSENANSVYTFEEENVDKNSTTSSTVSSDTSKRRRSELWRFFVTASSPKKKARTATHLKRRKSVHFYQCSRCIRVFQNNDLLSKHELIHSQNRGVSCNLCGGVFGGLGNLISHKKLTHNPPF